MAVTFIDGLKVEGNSEFNDHLGLNGDTTFATPLNIACSTVSDNGTFQRYYYAANNESFTLTLKQTVTSGVVRYNYSMVNGGTAYDDVLVLDRGNVGIGTTDPGEQLHVKTSSDTAAKFETTSTADLAIEVANSQGSMFFGLGGGEQFGIGTTSDLNGTGNLFIIEQGGNTGIGTTSPGAKLDVNGSIRANSSGTDGGVEIGVWDQSSSYNFIGTSGMSGLEYAMIFDGTNTFVGAGTSGALKLRGPANDSSPSIVIDGSSVTVDDGASVGEGAIRAKYKSSDNSAGITTTVGVKNASQSQNLTLTIKDGVVTGVSSDRRLKTNITLIGTSNSGINIYTFEYKYKFSIEGVGLFQGVMSDEVPAEAVSVDHHGFDVVDYSLIDVEFKRVSI